MATRLITVLFSVYLLMWLQSFAKTGVLDSDKQALNIYRRMTIITVCLTLFVLPLAGFTADKAPSAVTVPISCILRGAAAFLF